MRTAFIRLGGSASGIRLKDLMRYDRWSEANQFSPQNNAFILRAVERVVRRHESAAHTDNGKGSNKAVLPIAASAAQVDR